MFRPLAVCLVEIVESPDLVAGDHNDVSEPSGFGRLRPHHDRSALISLG